MIGTIKEIAKIANIEYNDLRATIKILVAKGIVKKAGERPRDKTGPAIALYDVPEGPISITIIPKQE